MSEDKNVIPAVAGVVAGVFAGLIFGVLFAPQPGEKTREQLKNTVEEINDSETVEKLKKNALISADVFRYKLDKMIRHAKNSVRARRLARAKDKEDRVYGI